ncbi:MAG: transglutaminase domain-containing protein [Opitutaceae bacterium]|nr:transglutaminase domain-containing protein [Opitutaceae bacterium]
MQLFCLQALPWLFPLFLLFLAANLYVFLTREWEASHYPASYASLYYPLDAPTLRSWKFEADGQVSLKLIWNRTPAQWQLLVDGQPAQVLPGQRLRFALVGPKFDGRTAAPIGDFKHNYTLRPLPAGSGPDLTFTITSISKDYYQTRGMNFSDMLLVKTEVPAGKFTRHPVSYWVDDYRYVGAAGLAAADRLVREEIGITDADGSLVRMEKIVRHLRTKLAQAGGVPKNDFRWMDPWRIFQEMSTGTGKGWCTQNAQIFTFLANRAGLPTRFVFGATVEANTIVYNGHSWAECYVREQNRWAYCDPLISLMAVQDKQGTVLNSADLLHHCDHDAFDGLSARIFKDWNWPHLAVEAAPGAPVTVPFAWVNEMAKVEFTQQSILKYRRPPNVEDLRNIYSMLGQSRVFAWTNFRRYLCTPDLAYSKFPTNGVATYRLRQSLFAGLTITALLLLASVF